jgi:hypothetical protein
MSAVHSLYPRHGRQPALAGSQFVREKMPEPQAIALDYRQADAANSLLPHPPFSQVLAGWSQLQATRRNA